MFHVCQTTTPKDNSYNNVLKHGRTHILKHIETYDKKGLKVPGVDFTKKRKCEIDRKL